MGKNVTFEKMPAKPLTIQETENGIRLRDIELIWARNSKEFFFSNSILIHDSTSPTLVDPSANFSYLEHLASQKLVKQVLNTHYHADHRSLNGLFRVHAHYLCHPLDKPYMSLENYLKYADPEKDSDYVRWLQGIFSSLDIQDPTFHRTLKEGELVPLADQEVRVVHLPGHTPGHIGLFFKEVDLLFTADVDLTPLGPWYANIPSNIDDFLRSLRRLRDWECTYYITSHGSRLYDREHFLRKLGRFTEAFEK
jgi:glyoxylase-like metal-dependent hydrolase (beta-lactamase superfamily II)